MESFKAGTSAPHGTKRLERVSAYFRTVRYVTRYRDRQGSEVCADYGPVFPATVLEWERARD